MLANYFCFSGQEVVNNERARGYAETASQVPNNNALPVGARDEQILATNVFTNPSLEQVDDAGTITIPAEVIYSNPLTSGDPTGWVAELVDAEGSGATGASMTTGGPDGAKAVDVRTVDATTSVDPTVHVRATLELPTIVGVEYTVEYSYRVVSAAAIAQVSFGTARGPVTTNNVLSPGEPITFVATDTTTALVLDAQDNPDLTATRDSVYAQIGGITVTQAAYEVPAPGLPSGVTPTGCTVTQSDVWAASGTYSMQVTDVTDGATITFDSAVTDGTLLYTSRDADGNVEDVRLTFTGTATITPPAGVETWYDNILIAEGDYTGAYFDGDTPASGSVQYGWIGPDGEAVSEAYIPGSLGEQPYYCNINWFTDAGKCDTLHEALFPSQETFLPPASEDELLPWEAGNIPVQAPWYSESALENGPASEFFGVYALSVTALSDSTRDLTITEGIADGGILGRTRLAVPQFRFRVMLTAASMQGIEYGTRWLSASLDEQNCTIHGPSCGSSDLMFFVACPPPFDPNSGGGYVQWWSDVNSMVRIYHDAKCTEGPIVIEDTFRPENSYGRVVEFTIAAGVPNLFGFTDPFMETDVPLSGSQVISDIPRNSIPTPSAELAGETPVIVATNYSTNPSVEVDVTGWVASSEGTTGLGTVAGARSTTLAAVGTASYRVQFTATGAGSAGVLQASQTVTLPTGMPESLGYSVNLWSSMQSAGTPVLGGIESSVVWSDGATDLRTDVLGAADSDGGPQSKTSIIPPAGATVATVRARGTVSSWASGDVVNLYADAVAVTIP